MATENPEIKAAAKEILELLASKGFIYEEAESVLRAVQGLYRAAYYVPLDERRRLTLREVMSQP